MASQQIHYLRIPLLLPEVPCLSTSGGSGQSFLRLLRWALYRPNKVTCAVWPVATATAHWALALWVLGHPLDTILRTFCGQMDSFGRKLDYKPPLDITVFEWSGRRYNGIVQYTQVGRYTFALFQQTQNSEGIEKEESRVNVTE